MNGSELYDIWKSRRRAVEVDESFADRVIEKIRQSDPPGTSRLVFDGHNDGPASHRYLAAALVVVSVLVGILRVGSVIAFVLFASTEGF